MATGGLSNGILSLEYSVDFNGPPSAFNPAKGVILARLTWPFQITRVIRDGASLLLEWLGGKPPYKVKSSSDLSAWTDVIPSTENTNATVTISPAGKQFYRVTGQP